MAFYFPTNMDIAFAEENDRAFACGHIRPLFDAKNFSIIVRKCVAELRPFIKDFQAIAITGYSSALIGPAVAMRLKKNLCLVRKEGEKCASGYGVEGLPNQKYVFIDDLICSGRTLQRVYTNMRMLKGTLVGVWLYNDGCNDKACWQVDLQEKICGLTDQSVKLLNKRLDSV